MNVPGREEKPDYGGLRLRAPENPAMRGEKTLKNSLNQFIYSLNKHQKALVIVISEKLHIFIADLMI